MTTTGFIPSRLADNWTKPLPRVRSDRAWVELERSRMRWTWLEIGNTAGFIVFVLACIALMCV